jgi:hypothetical protein
MRIFTPLLALAACGLTACDSLDKPKVVITVHSQGTDMDMPKTIFRRPINGQNVIFKVLPEFSQQNVAGVHTFPAADGTFGVTLKLDFKGTNSLDLTTRMRSGEMLMSMVNGTVVDYVQIDKPVSDGIFTIWRGLPEELVAELKKKYPPVSTVKSSSEFVDMTPSTRKEKKTSMSDAKKAAKEKAKADKDALTRPPRSEFDPEPPKKGAAVPLSELLKDQ